MRAHKPSTVQQVLDLLAQDKSIRQVAKELNLPKSTVHQMSKKLPHIRKKIKGGRPRKLSHQNASYLRLLFKRGHIDTVTEAAELLNSGHKDTISTGTIRRALRDIGMMAKRVKDEPLLKARRKEARLEAHQHLTEDDKSLLLGSAAIKIKRFGSEGNGYRWVDSKEDPKVKVEEN